MNMFKIPHYFQLSSTEFFTGYNTKLRFMYPQSAGVGLLEIYFVLEYVRMGVLCRKSKFV